MKFILFVVFAICCVFGVYGMKKELNPKKVNLAEFIEAMQTCGTTLGFDKEFKLHLYGSQEDFNRTLCLSFCALRKLKLYIVEDELKKELESIAMEDHLKFKEEVNKALDACKQLLDDPCKLFDCFFDYARSVDGSMKYSFNLTKFFSEGSF